MALVLVNPHNPTEQIATRAELNTIANVVERTNSHVFADEIHFPGVFRNTGTFPMPRWTSAPRHTQSQPCRHRRVGTFRGCFALS